MFPYQTVNCVRSYLLESLVEIKNELESFLHYIVLYDDVCMKGCKEGDCVDFRQGGGLAN